MEHTVEEVKLKCGAKGLLIDVPQAPVFVMELWFRGGYSKVKDYKKYEAAHIMEHLAFGANSQHKNVAEVDRYIKKYGAYSNAWTGTDYLAYVRICPDFDWSRLLEQLVVQVTTPKFLEKEFKSEFGNVQEEFRGRANNKWGELSAVMNQRFGWEYCETDQKRLKLMENVKLKDIKEHYKRTHSADNAVFFVAGNLSGKKKEIIRILEGLKDLPEGGRFMLSEYPGIKSYNTPVVIPKKEVDNVYFSMEMHANSSGPMDMLDINLNLGALSDVLAKGDHSRIYGYARQKGWVYGLWCSSVSNRSGAYSFEIYCQVGKENIDNLLNLIVKTYKDVKLKGLKESEVEEAVMAMKGGRKMDNQTVNDVASWYAGWYTSFEEENLRDYDASEKRYDEINKDVIQDLFLNLIKTKKWGAGFLGNVTEKDAKKWNAKLAKIFED